LFVNGKDQEYTGGRSEQSVVTWVLRKVGPPAVKLEDAAAAANFEAEHKFAAIALFPPGGVREAFELAARQVEDVMFAYSESPEVLARYGLSAPALRMFFPHDARSADLTSDISNAEEIQVFVKAHRYPMVTTFDGEVAAELFGDGRPLLFLFRDRDAKGEAAEAEIRKAAPGFRRRILVSVAGSSEPMDQRLMDYVGVDPEELPAVRLVANPLTGMVKYKLEGELTEASIAHFGQTFEAGGLKPHLKSEAEPTSQPGPVFTLVGSTFGRVVKDPTKDVMVEFYAPWCGHCKKLEPVYREVAKRVERVSTLIIAKMDATANDAEGVDVEGFPTIKFWAASKKDEPLEYDGDRDVESFVGWLEEKATFPFSQEELKSEL
jgi:protein disulfide-isomerase A1